MKKTTLLFYLLTATCFCSIAQTVTIPDTNFVKWMKAVIPSAINGNQLDTSNTEVKTITIMDVENRGITDLTGVQYFPSLIGLHCGNNNVVWTPNAITALPHLPAKLQAFTCHGNKLTSLPALPDSLTYLKCQENKLTSLPALPNTITYIECGFNQLTSLPALPTSLTRLFCEYNKLTGLPALPGTLNMLWCNDNQLTSLPALPNPITMLKCYNNKLTTLPALPLFLETLECQYNQLTSLPAIPNLLNNIKCDYNELSSLPTLDTTNLFSLSCRSNKLTSLPALPKSLGLLLCMDNQLTTLPTLPNFLYGLNCSNNNITCFPVFPTSLSGSNNCTILPNPISCLPNYVAGMNTAALAYPLCVAGDTLNNPHACHEARGISGFIYKNMNANCINDSTDVPLLNIRALIYDGNNNLLGQTYSAENGIYQFPDSAGTYSVKIDTAGMPFMAQCIHPGIDSTVVLTTANPLAKDVNFGLTCKASFDIGTQSVLRSGWVFPGRLHDIRIMAGDLSQWHNFHCATGVSGQVKVTVNGPAKYHGIVMGARTPSVSGNMLTYDISDFGAVDIYNDFGLSFRTDTTAHAGDWICILITITSSSGDNNTENNTFYFCYQVLNSHDPNLKEVYPTDVLPGYQDWFTYTVHFQNTGSAPAFNIRLVDTLDINLDLSTFQLLNYSHKNAVSFNKNELTFRFPNIMLADCTSDEKRSHGYVQYRIKPKAGLSNGTQITNTANIYFDYNPAIVTNTTINNFTFPTAIKENGKAEDITIYPNPGNGIYHVKLPENITTSAIIQVYDVLGKLVSDTKAQNNTAQIDLSNQPKGVYIFRINGGNNSFNQLIIKQ
jgi:uncharacterized repeat protein (TIGR01451 family)